MDTLDEMKEKWAKADEKTVPYNQENFLRLIRLRVKKNLGHSMNYFWASFALQLIVYGFYTHVTLKYMADTRIVMLSLAGMLAYMPFTYVLMKKFKLLATTKPIADQTSVRDHIMTQKKLLQDFFRFKMRYEWMLIPLSSLIGSWLVFKIYVPGGPEGSAIGLTITFLVTLASCYLAIRKENQKAFRSPLKEFDELLIEFSE